MSAATGALQRTIDGQRARLLSGDAALHARIVANYQASIARLDAPIAAMRAELAAHGSITVNEALRLDRWVELRRQLRIEVATLLATSGHDLTAVQRQAVRLGQGDASDLISGAVAAAGPAFAASLGVAGQAVRINAGAVEGLVGAMTPGSPLHDLFAAVNADAPGIAERILADGIATGQGPAAVARAISRAMDVSATRAMTISRTELLRSYRSASLAQFAANADILDGWTWISALSPRTCANCLALDGSFHKLTEIYFPAHPACRCSAAPVVKGYDPVIDPNRGRDYFDGLPPDQQDSILGKGGGSLYRSGALTLRDFVHEDHSPQWGTSFRQGSVADALATAAARGRRAA